MTDISIQDNVTVTFSTPKERFTWSVLLCLRIQVYLELDYGSICKSEKGLLIFASPRDRLVRKDPAVGSEIN